MQTPDVASCKRERSRPRRSGPHNTRTFCEHGHRNLRLRVAERTDQQEALRSRNSVSRNMAGHGLSGRARRACRVDHVFATSLSCLMSRPCSSRRGRDAYRGQLMARWCAVRIGEPMDEEAAEDRVVHPPTARALSPSATGPVLTDRVPWRPRERRVPLGPSRLGPGV